jgi:hypothetical protein
MLRKKPLSNNSINSIDSRSYSVDSRSYSIDSRSYSIDSISCEIRPQSSESIGSTVSIGLTISPCNSYEENSFLKKQLENENKNNSLIKKKKEENDLTITNIEKKEKKEKKRRKKDFNYVPLQKEPKTVEQLKKSMKKII